MRAKVDHESRWTVGRERESMEPGLDFNNGPFMMLTFR